MIWLNRQGGAGPLGTKYGSVSLGGAMWDVYRGDIGWNVYSFVRRANTTGATLNLDDFTRALVRRRLLSGDEHVSGVESGSEVFKGSGRPDIRSYSVGIGWEASTGAVGLSSDRTARTGGGGPIRVPTIQ